MFTLLSCASRSVTPSTNGDQLPLPDALSETDKDAWVQMLGAGAAAQWDELGSLQQLPGPAGFDADLR